MIVSRIISASVFSFVVIHWCAATSLSMAMVANAEDYLPDHNVPDQEMKGERLVDVSLDHTTQTGWKVIYFWSSICPCVSACERWTFLPLAQRYQGQVHFYAVVSGKYDLDLPPDQLREKIAAHRLPYPVLLDPQHQVAKTLGAVVTPEAFLIDPHNHVLFAGMPDDSRRYLARTGHSGITQSYLGQALAQALAGKPVTRPQVKDEGCIIAW